MSKDDKNNSDPSKEIILYAQDLVSEHLNRELGWTTELDHKAASLISVNGIVLALEVPLVVFLLNIIKNVVSTPLIIIIYVIFLLQLTCFIYSLWSSYKGHKIESFEVPNITLLVGEILEGHKFERKYDAVIQHISDVQESSKTVHDIIEKKAMNVSRSQRFFFLGGISIAILLCVLILIGII